MPELDLLIRGGKPFPEIGVADGKIVSFSGGPAREEIDASGLHIFPGVIDAHVHFNEPGRANWEGIETGSQALAAGGGTVFFDMPLNAHPPTCDAESFDLKFAAAKKNSLADFAFWGGLVPGNLDKLEELAGRGVIGFKAFMSDSGIDDFARVEDGVLREGMKQAAKLKLPVAVHAESEMMTKQLAAERIAKGQTTIRDYLNSRPVAAELDAIRRAIDLAGETGCALHVVHVSSGAGVALITDAKKRGVDVSCETCPHYLVLTEDDVESIGAIAKCAPPLRSNEVQDALWERLFAGEITTVGSDHSPSPPEMKRDANFFQVWGGISGVQHTLSLLLEGGRKREGGGIKSFLLLVAELTAANVARRFRIPNKGKIEVGFDADFALVDLKQSFAVRSEDLFYRHKHSPYVGRTLTGRVVQTILRGKTIFKNGRTIRAGGGQLIKPI